MIFLYFFKSKEHACNASNDAVSVFSVNLTLPNMNDARAPLMTVPEKI